MKYAELESIILRQNGTIRCYIFDSGYRLYGTVNSISFSKAHEWGDEMRKTYVFPEDIIYRDLIYAGAIPEDDASTSDEGTYSE